MSRPNLDWFERRLSGSEGWAIRNLMTHTRVHELIAYIKELESNGNKAMHEVQDREKLQ
jgi:hypothetical protein